MRYQHEFLVDAPLSAVADFHSRSKNMAAITPPPILVRMKEAPEQLAEGSPMAFTLWAGPLPIPWVSRIEAVTQYGFIDRQLEGPFKTWIHQHSYAPLSATKTLVRDEIQAELKRHPWWGLVGLAMWLGMPLLFAYRAWQTRRILHQLAAVQS
jgi:ligand-binding SRPBCC domain-containing protein